MECCFKCGGKGHIVQQCKNKTRCAVCAEMDMDYGYRMGSSRYKGVTIPVVDRSGRTSKEKVVLSTRVPAGTQF